MAITLRFVQNIAANPNLRMDFTSGTWGFIAKEADFSPPKMRRSVAQSTMRDGDLITNDAYENRVLKIPVRKGVSLAARIGWMVLGGVFTGTVVFFITQALLRAPRL